VLHWITEVSMKAHAYTTGRALEHVAMYGGKHLRSRVTPAIKPQGASPAVVYVAGTGKTAKLLQSFAAPAKAPYEKPSRFISKRVKRNRVIAALKGQREEGYTSSCVVAVVREMIHVARPKYQGVGVWA
jgi:hypothetical protein